MGLLLYLFIGYVVLCGVLSLLMFLPKDKKKLHIVAFVALIIITIVGAFEVSRGLPTNFIKERIGAWCAVIPALIGVILALTKKNATASKILIILSWVYNVIYFICV